MILSRACPKCGGDMGWNDEEERWVCIQCGERKTQETMEVIVNRRVRRKKALEMGEIMAGKLRFKDLDKDTLLKLPVPPKPDVSGDKWPKHRLIMHAYYEENKEQIKAEVEKLRELTTRKRWGIPSGTWAYLKKRWGLPIGKWGRSRQNKKGSPSATKVNQSHQAKVELIPVPPLPDPYTKGAMRKYLDENTAQILAEVGDYGERFTKRRWGIADSTWSTRKMKWGLLPYSPSRQPKLSPCPKKQQPKAAPVKSSTRLPNFPAFNEEWRDKVKVSWFESYVELSKGEIGNQGIQR